MYKHLKETGKLISKILIFCICIVIFNHFIAQRVVVVGSSMEPSYSDGQNLILEKLSYHFTSPDRFDVIVVDTEGPYGIIIKRIIGLPGEHILINENGDIIINGEILEEKYGREVISSNKRGIAEKEIILNEDEYFILGDNRNDSGDSRIEGIGNIKKDQILGKIILKIPFIKG